MFYSVGGIGGFYRVGGIGGFCEFGGFCGFGGFGGFVVGFDILFGPYGEAATRSESHGFGEFVASESFVSEAVVFLHSVGDMVRHECKRVDIHPSSCVYEGELGCELEHVGFVLYLVRGVIAFDDAEVFEVSLEEVCPQFDDRSAFGFESR